MFKRMTFIAICGVLFGGVSGCQSAQLLTADPQDTPPQEHSQAPPAHSKATLEDFVQDVKGSTATLRMIAVPAGSVTLDDPTSLSPAEHKKTTREIKAMWVSATEVPWPVYDAFVFALDEEQGASGGDMAITRPSKPYLPMDRGFGHDGYPAISMSYHGAEEFCKWLSLRTGRTYRLPTEAEWVYIAQAGKDESAGKSTGDQIKEMAWCESNADGTTHPIGKRKPNAWGIYDCLGNAAEWCKGLDGQPIVKGGSFHDAPDMLTYERRIEPTPKWDESDPQIPKSVWWLADCNFVGFRVVCENGGGGGGNDR